MREYYQTKLEARKRSIPGVVAALILVFCGGVVGWVMAFGNPNLWMSEAQVEQLHNAGVDEQTSSGQVVLGSCTAVTTSDDEARMANIAEAAKRINGLTLEPTEVFSFNNTVGDSEHDEAFALAPAVVGNSVVQQRGGGVCQVSSAIYVAAKRAGLQVDQRKAHSITIDYVPLGLDATVTYDYLDLVITNNTDYPVKLYVTTSDKSVTASFVGTPRDDGVTYEIYSEVSDSYSKNGLTTYYTVSSYQVKYKNGIQVAKDLIAVDTYRATNVEFSVSPVPTDGSSK